MHRSNLSSWIALSLLASMLSACGGGGSGPKPPTPTPTFTVGGTVSGLTGAGLVLVNNGGNALPVTASGAFTFTTPIASGSAYSVTIQTQPAAQTCSVASGSGTIGANVTTVAVTCGALATDFPIGGTVSGLANGATGLVLTVNGGDNKAISANGAFTFATNLAIGASYDVRVLSNPYDPYQDCEVANGSGTVTNVAVTAPTITCKTLEARFATTLDFNDSSYSQYAVDAATGQLRSRGYARVGSNPIAVGAYADGRISFVLSKGTAQLHAFVRDTVTGRITEASGSPALLAAVPTQGSNPPGAQTLTVHPRLNFVYVANGGGSTAANSIAAFSFNTTSGALTQIPGQPFAAGQRPVGLTIDPTGRFAYASNFDDNTLAAYSIDQTTGVLTALSAAVPAGGSVASYPVVHPSGKWLYVPNVGPTASVSAFTIGANGALTAVAGSPFAAPANLTAPLLMHPSGQYIYAKAAPAGIGGTVLGYRIEPTTGALTQVATAIPVDIDPRTIWMEASGRYLFTANQGIGGAGSISVIRVNATTGELSKLTGIPALSPAPYAVSLDWSGKYLFSASALGNTLRTFSFNLTTGDLTSSSNGELMSRNGPVSIISIPSASGAAATFLSKFAYVPTQATIDAFSVNATTGAYTARTGIGSGSSPITPVLDVVVHPSNTALLALDDLFSGTLKSYPLNKNNGNLSPSTDSVGAGNAPNGVAVDPSGRFAYVVDTNGPLLNAFSWNAAAGDLTSATASGTAALPLALAMHPTGRFLFYVSNDHIGARAINTSDGALSNVGGIESIVGTTGQQTIAVAPNGRFAYVAINGTPGSIDGYAVTRATGELVGPTHLTNVGNSPRSIAIDPTGRFMYVAQMTPYQVLAFRIASNGGITPIGAPESLSGTSPVRVRTDYSGKLLHVVDGNQVRTYAIDQSTGALTATGAAIVPTTSPTSLALSEDIE